MQVLNPNRNDFGQKIMEQKLVFPVLRSIQMPRWRSNFLTKRPNVQVRMLLGISCRLCDTHLANGVSSSSGESIFYPLVMTFRLSLSIIFSSTEFPNRASIVKLSLLSKSSNASSRMLCAESNVGSCVPRERWLNKKSAATPFVSLFFLIYMSLSYSMDSAHVYIFSPLSFTLAMSCGQSVDITIALCVHYIVIEWSCGRGGWHHQRSSTPAFFMAFVNMLDVRNLELLSIICK